MPDQLSLWKNSSITSPLFKELLSHPSSLSAISGIVGIGKTIMSCQLALRLLEDGKRVIWCHGYTYPILFDQMVCHTDNFMNFIPSDTAAKSAPMKRLCKEFQADYVFCGDDLTRIEPQEIRKISHEIETHFIWEQATRPPMTGATRYPGTLSTRQAAHMVDNIICLDISNGSPQGMKTIYANASKSRHFSYSDTDVFVNNESGLPQWEYEKSF